jgi:1,4-dihydroxy-2-naphthoate octaprenyltransferase
MKGTDNVNRLGPMRAIQSGEISQNEMKTAVIITSILAAFSASYLIYIGTQGMPVEVLYFYAVLAILCIVAAITYTVGKKAYGYNGLGDVFVFLFFGLVSVLGSFTLFTKYVDYGMILPAATIGLLSTAVLNLNNMRDRVNDKASNKITLVVHLGPTLAKFYHAFLILGGLVTWLIYISTFENPIFYVSALPFLVLILHLRKVLQTKEERAYDPELKKVALSTFFVSLLWVVLITFTI